MNKHVFFATALVAAMAAAPAFAQSGGSATLTIERGSAMVSTGGEFVTVQSGAQVPAGARVMLADGSRANLSYANGCSQPLPQTGVYNVPTAQACLARTSSNAAAGGVDMMAVGIVAGTVALGAAGLASMEKDDGVPQPPPVSR